MIPVRDEIAAVYDYGAPFTDDEVTEFLFPTIVQGGDPTLEERARKFAEDGLQTLDEAQWAGRKLRDAKARADEVRANVAMEIARLREYEAAACAEADGRVAWFSHLLVTYANAQRQASNGEVKSVKLAAATVSGTKRTPTVEMPDPAKHPLLFAAFVEWARETCPDAVVDQPPKLYKGKLSNVRFVEDEHGRLDVFANGEKVPGVHGADPEVGPTVRTVVVRRPGDDGAMREDIEFIGYTVKPTPPPAPPARHLEAVPDPDEGDEQ